MPTTLYDQLNRRFGPYQAESSRRNFLKTIAATGAAMMLASCTSKEEKIQKLAATKHVIVVGAGFAGLACAFELRSAGYKVSVIDARNRLGGRVVTFTDFIPKRVVEGGGELIGANHPVWTAYAHIFRLQLDDITEDESLNAPMIFEGKTLSAADGRKLYEQMGDVLGTMNDEARKVDEDAPWKTPGAAELDRRTTSEWLDASGAKDLCKAAVAAQLEGTNGVALQRQSFLGNLAQVKGGGLEKYWTDTESRHCREGNQELARRMADSIGSENIYTSTRIAAISTGINGVIVSTADGWTLEADDLVLAIPPAVWSKINFIPLLPPFLNPQNGSAVKYLTMVKSRFWKSANLSARGQGDGAVSETWESTKAQGGDKPAGLTAFSGGAAAEICRGIPADGRDSLYAKAMERMYPGFTDQFVKSRFMDWPSDKLTLCGYPFPAPGEITTMGPVLHQGIGRLHFAGDHTCYKFVGYMEGALQSGLRAARTIAQRDGIPIRAATRPA